jgi:hypothetical protein
MTPSHFIFILVLFQSISIIYSIENVFINDSDSMQFSVVPCRRQESLCPLLPTVKAMDAKTVFCRNRHFLLGGYTDYATKVNPYIQELIDVGNGNRASWTNLVKLPLGAPQTHHASVCGDESTSILLYLIGGQVGPAFGPATALSFALDVNLNWHRLPSLPGFLLLYSMYIIVILFSNMLFIVKFILIEPRYSAWATVNDFKLHVFGGSLPSRWEGARQHWQLTLDSNGLPYDGDDNNGWKAMPDLPFVGNPHGNELQHDRHLYVFGQVLRDQGRFDNGSISMLAQNLKTIEASGFKMFAGGRLSWHRIELAHLHEADAWQELPPMKERVGNSGFVVIGNELWSFGGRVDSLLATTIIQSSSAVQVFNFDTLEWRLHNNRLPQPLKTNVVVFDIVPNTLTLIDTPEERVSATRCQLLDRRQHVELFNKQQLLQWPTLRLRQCLSIDDPLVVWRTSSSFIKHAFGVNKAWHARGSWPIVIVFIRSGKIMNMVAILVLLLTKYYYYVVEQLQNVIRCAAKSNVRVCARNGAHSFAGASNCGDGVVVDISSLNSTSLYFNDDDDNDVRFKVGSGARLGTVAASLFDHWDDADDDKNLYYMPMGHCSTVGVGGLTLAGGHGIGARMLGLTSQRLAALEMIDAKGRLLKISSTSHPDL